MSYFALLDDARRQRATLFDQHVRSEWLEPGQLSTLDACLKRGWAAGLHVVLFADYEFGLPLQQLPPQDGRLVLHWFAGKHELNDPESWLAEQGGSEPAGISRPKSQTDEAVYHQAINRIRAAIERGDTYQINYTTRLHLQSYGHPAKLYARLRQPVPYAALACLPGKQQSAEWTLCFSPELFLRILPNGEIFTEPMKGTAPVRPGEPEADSIRALQQDPKNRAENIMIVDLLRNDLGKIAQTGSVNVPDPLKVGRFGSVWQMTSTVRAQLKPGVSAADLFQATFPCGSITGAPKRMSMQLIRQLENHPRGLYTGSIGHLAPAPGPIGFQGCMNVVIRTLQLHPQHNGSHSGVYGVGSGVVWDSDAAEEYRECAWKARFLSRLRPQFGLFETLAICQRRSPLLPQHLDRIERSAQALNIPFERAQAEEYIQGILESLSEAPQRLKISLQPDGSWQHEAAALTPLTQPQTVLIATRQLPNTDYLRRFKTTHRAVYDNGWQQAAAQGAFDSLFFNQNGHLLEGGRSNVFVCINGQWHTPALELDILNGVMRQTVLADPQPYLSGSQVQESRISLPQLRQADKIMLCNALRGVFEVTL